MSIKNLDALFNPQRIAVIGASEDEKSIGYHIFRNLSGQGFKGVVYPVAPHMGNIQGVEAYKTVCDIPHPIDLAMVATHPDSLLAVLEDCGQKGVKGVVILAPDHMYRVKNAQQISEYIRKFPSMHGCRVLGPNSLGLLRPAKNLNASLYPEMPQPGNIAFISESGIFSTAFLERAISKKVGFSYFISLGSKLDINFSDVIDFLGGDFNTRAIFLHINNIKNGRRFVTAVRSFASTKPIVIVKSEKDDVFSHLSITHSGCLAEEDLIYEAAFKRAGALRVNDMVDLLYMVETISKQKRPKGNRLLIISNSIAPSNMAIDALKTMGGALAIPSQATLETISENLPIRRDLLNPVYLLADASSKDYKVAIETCLKDSDVDGVLVICIPFPGIDLREIADVIVAAVIANPQTPLFTTWCGEQTALKEIGFLNSKGIPTYYTPAQAVKSFMYMYRYDYNLKLLQETPEIVLKDFTPDLKNAESILRNSIERKRFSLHMDKASEIIRSYGIPVIQTVRVSDEEEAVVEARRIGYPVVMKIDSLTVHNRVMKGGVLINLKDDHEVRNGFKNLKNLIVSVKDPDAQMILQPMVIKIGYQLAIGAKKSKNFGTVILFGLGGEYLRAEKDYAIGLPPLNQTLARRMMEETKIYRYIRTIDSYKGSLRILEEMLVRFSQLIIDLPQISEIDINPFLLTPNDGIFVFDVDIQLDEQLPKEYRWVKGDLCPLHLSIPPYPFRYERKLLLKDGTAILIRPIRGEDEPLLRCFFESLTDESVFLRFCQRRINMPHNNLARFCQVDYDRDLAFLAVEQEGSNIIGNVQLNRLVDIDSAELSFIVDDQWQGKGVGGILMDYCLSVAREIGLKTLCMEILKENPRMIKLGHKNGFKQLPGDEDDDMVEMLLHINQVAKAEQTESESTEET
jgi:acetyltransferase